MVVHTLTILKSVMPTSIRVETQLTPGDLWVLADDTQLKQIVMNLCLNARDAMPQGGKLSVRTMRQEHQGRSWIGCSVQDNGCGLPEPTERLTEPYVTTRPTGTGLGLAIVKKIMEEHGGTLTLRNRAAGGAQVMLAFPAFRAFHGAAAE